MKPTKVEFTERIEVEVTDNIIVQCRNLIHTRIGGANSFTHSRKACKLCKYRFRCWTLK